MATPKPKATKSVKPKAPRTRKPKVTDEPVLLDIELPNYDSAHDPFSLMNPTNLLSPLWRRR